MSNEKELGAGARVLGDEMSRAMKRRAVDPTRREAEGVQLDAQHVAYAPHTGKIHRAAVDVDNTLQQCERSRILGIHRSSNDTLFRREGGAGGLRGRP